MQLTITNANVFLEVIYVPHWIPIVIVLLAVFLKLDVVLMLQQMWEKITKTVLAVFRHFVVWRQLFSANRYKNLYASKKIFPAIYKFTLYDRTWLLFVYTWLSLIWTHARTRAHFWHDLIFIFALTVSISFLVCKCFVSGEARVS